MNRVCPVEPIRVSAHSMSLYGAYKFFTITNSPQAVAKTVVHNEVFGFKKQNKAIQYGDVIIPLIVKESKDFTLLGSRNSIWIAEILGSIDSELSRKTLIDLYEREDELMSMVGTYGLCKKKEYPKEINEDSELIKVLGNDGFEIKQELAIKALRFTKSAIAIEPLHNILVHRSNNYAKDYNTCITLGYIRSSKSIQILRECLKDPEFIPFTEAYRVLVSLGDKEATPLTQH